MSDLISRCELFNRLATIPAPPEANEFKAKIYEAIQGMETADRLQGEWIDVHTNYKYVRACSECGWQHDVVHYGDSFCPHCGARMKGASE